MRGKGLSEFWTHRDRAYSFMSTSLAQVKSKHRNTKSLWSKIKEVFSFPVGITCLIDLSLKKTDKFFFKYNQILCHLTQ